MKSKIFFFCKIFILKTFIIIFFNSNIANATTNNKDYYNLEKLKKKNNLVYNYNYACTYTKNEFHDEFQYLLKKRYANPMVRSSILVYGFSLASFKYVDKTRILFSLGIYNKQVNFLTTPISELKYEDKEYVFFEYNVNNNIVIKNSVKKKDYSFFDNTEKFYLLKHFFLLKEEKYINELKKLKASFDNLKYEKDYIILLDKLRNYTEITITSSDLINKEYYVCALYQ